MIVKKQSFLKTPMRRALFIQYTNPAGYPPLQHAMAALLDAGWHVHCLAANHPSATPLRLPTHANLRVDITQRPSPGLLQKAHYLAYCLRSLWVMCLRRPDLVYTSDPMATPPALVALAIGIRSVVYHEHDAPGQTVSRFQAFVGKCRTIACRKATLVVVPNRGRANDIARVVGDDKRLMVVFNCPSQTEALAEPSARPAMRHDAPVWLYFHGSIVPDRLPATVIDALSLLPDRVHLRIAGYETAGSSGYTQKLLDRAQVLGIVHRLELVGTIPERSALLQYARDSHLGLSLMPMESDDINMIHMVGASNKPFDYLASGCLLIVSDLPEWREMYVDAGLANACDPRSPDSIARAVRGWLDDEPRYLRAQQSGLKRVATEWNYQVQFEPVLQRITDGISDTR